MPVAQVVYHYGHAHGSARQSTFDKELSLQKLDILAITRAAAAVMTRRTAARPAMPKASTRQSTGPNCALSTPSIVPAHAFGNDLLTEVLTWNCSAQAAR
jgi:hypothetical protein